MIGQSIAHFEITAKIGEGGMGEVYQATDTKLNREVALKVLPESFARDPQRMGRFSREAQVLASLNHSNIAAIYGLEDANGQKALVMELVEGEDLSERIARGPIPLDEALPIALQIAEALEDAHEKGIIHRDLKPENIKLTSEGKVKVLDFGLAKAVEEERSAENIANSPTLTMQATQAGIILGTAAYMSPEQAKGHVVDRRADIWAFGAVLYEMLTGQQAFKGGDLSEIMAAVIMKDVDLDILPSIAPKSIRRLIARCLARDTRQRLQHIGDARLVIEDYLAGPTEDTSEETISSVATQPLGRSLVPWTVAGVLAIALIAVLVVTPQPAPQPLTRMAMVLPSDQQLSSPGRHQVAFSPDGQHLVYVANDQLYLRAMEQLEATPIRGTTEGGGRNPFFSPDGQWVGFWAGDGLKKVAITGGVPVTLCGAANPWGASWGADDRIVFGQGTEGIFQVSANGGEKGLLIRVDSENESAHGPQILPGGDAVLFTLSSRSGSWDNAQIMVQSLKTGERKVLVNGGTDARYVPTGHLVYVQERTLLAMPFDVVRLEVTGGRVPIVEDVGQARANLTGAAQFTFSDLGALVYVSDSTSGMNRTLVWVDREGNEEPLAAETRSYSRPGLSPDGEQLAVTASDRGNTDVWIYDLRRNTSNRLTFDPGIDDSPVWMPDGRRVVFESSREGGGVYWKAADGTGQVQPLTTSPLRQIPYSVSPDGKYLILMVQNPETGFDVEVLSMEGESTTKPIIQTEFGDYCPAVSPDGRWIAYHSDASGQPEVYVRPFPNVEDGRWLISSGGGNYPVWAPTGKELFYTSFDRLMAVRIETEPFLAGNPEILFTGNYFSPIGRNYDIHPEGQKFLMMREVEQTGGTRQELIVVQNWFEELKRLVPTE